MKIWFDRNKICFKTFITEKFLLMPFYERQIIKSNKDFKNADNWIDSCTNIIHEVPQKEANVFVYHDKLDTGISDTIQLATKLNKQIIAFYNDDNSAPTSLPPCVDLYRTSLHKSKQKINEYSFPAWSEDFGTAERLHIRSKSEKPVVGFCGAVTHPIRHTAISLIEKNTNLNTNFLIRGNFWGGSIHDPQIREEYICNINSSDMVLCCRGAGNFSYRLYETISLGRVPIIVDTDIVLPCDDMIDWKSISIWVEDINLINDSINNFWQKITDIDYKKLQTTIRDTYEKYICPTGFTSYLSNKYQIP